MRLQGGRRQPTTSYWVVSKFTGGCSLVSSIRLDGKIKSKEVESLVDIRTTHNFIDPTTTRCLGLQPNEINTFNDKVEDGETIVGGECCTEKKMSIQRFDSQTDLLIIPMGDSQVVLRVYD